MNYSDREIEALAQWAMSPDPVNWELFNSQPLEERLRFFDWWWDRWEGAEFRKYTDQMFYEAIYRFLGLDIYLILGVMKPSVIMVHVYYQNRVTKQSSSIYCTYIINNTDDLPLDRIKADIYNAIKNHITNE